MKNEALLISRAVLLSDRKAFGCLVELHQSSIRRFLYHLTEGDEEVAKDLAQDVFLKAWLNIGNFRMSSRFSTWLYRIAYNTFYDYMRSKKPLEELNDGIAVEHIHPEREMKDFSMDFTQAMKVLNEKERTAMLLFYMEDLSIEKISKIMTLPSGTIKSHLSRGKKKLASYLTNEGYNQ